MTNETIIWQNNVHIGKVKLAENDPGNQHSERHEIEDKTGYFENHNKPLSWHVDAN